MGGWDGVSALAFAAIAALLLWVAVSLESPVVAVVGVLLLASALFTGYASSRADGVGPTTHFIASAPRLAFSLLLWLSLLALQIG